MTQSEIFPRLLEQFVEAGFKAKELKRVDNEPYMFEFRHKNITYLVNCSEFQEDPEESIYYSVSAIDDCDYTEELLERTTEEGDLDYFEEFLEEIQSGEFDVLRKTWLAVQKLRDNFEYGTNRIGFDDILERQIDTNN
jgi:hypothetical protein